MAYSHSHFNSDSSWGESTQQIREKLMKVLLILSHRAVHRAENVALYESLKAKVKGLTWCAGTSHDVYRMLESNMLYLDKVEVGSPNRNRATKFEWDSFDIAIIDQSHDMTQDQSPSLFAGIPGFGGNGPANRSLDFEGYDRPSGLVRYLTRKGVVCIGTSRDGKCLDELVSEGAVMTCPLNELTAKIDALMVEARRLSRENRDDPKAGLKGLTLRQPWAWTMFHTTKDIENRNWPAKVRGTIAIHAADDQPEGVYERSKAFIEKIACTHAGLRIPAEAALPKGAIIGLVDIVECVDSSTSPWWEGPLGFKLVNARKLPKPIPCKGKRRFFTVPKSVESQIRAMGML
jgi:ASCH domain.